MAESSITCLSIYAELYIFHAALKYLLSSSCVVKVQVSSCFSKTSSLDPDFKPNSSQSRLAVPSHKCSSDKRNLYTLQICMSSGVCHPCGISFCTPSCRVSQQWTLHFTSYWAEVTSCIFFMESIASQQSSQISKHLRVLRRYILNNIQPLVSEHLYHCMEMIKACIVMDPGKVSRPGWMGLWATWTGGSCPCSCQGDWNEV